jgi:hypothetical protein
LEGAKALGSHLRALNQASRGDWTQEQRRHMLGVHDSFVSHVFKLTVSPLDLAFVAGACSVVPRADVSPSSSHLPPLTHQHALLPSAVAFSTCIRVAVGPMAAHSVGIAALTSLGVARLVRLVRQGELSDGSVEECASQIRKAVYGPITPLLFATVVQGLRVLGFSGRAAVWPTLQSFQSLGVPLGGGPLRQLLLSAEMSMDSSFAFELLRLAEATDVKLEEKHVASVHRLLLRTGDTRGALLWCLSHRVAVVGLPPTVLDRMLVDVAEAATGQLSAPQNHDLAAIQSVFIAAKAALARRGHLVRQLPGRAETADEPHDARRLPAGPTGAL